MNLAYFIKRPVFSIVISVTIVLLGVIALVSLPIEQFPDIAPPTIQVTTSYPGANAESAQKAVLVPLEEAINGVENMSYISSKTSSSGDVTIEVYFRPGTDPDMAAVNVQNRVSKALGVLPAEVTRIGVQTVKEQKSTLLTFGLYSPEGLYDMQFLNNYISINIEPRIKRIPGIGDFQLHGSQYAMRIWLKPDVMSQYGLVPSDIVAALNTQNLEAATGSFGENHENSFEYTVKYRGRLTDASQFGDIVIRAQPDGQVLRLKDVARIQLGDEAYSSNTIVNGKPGAVAEMAQSAGSNATQVVNDVKALLKELEKDLPPGTEFVDLQSVNDFLYASIHEVVWTLIIAIILVVVVVYFFLQDFKAIIITILSIGVSIVGTFGFMAVAHFSINLLTLFALVLVIGIVVDNAIIVVEAVQAKFDEGYTSSYQATKDALSGITSAIITSTLVFMAVFIPVSMMGGTSGVFYRQFGLTMAVSVGISALNALTMCPALCSLMLRPVQSGKRNFETRFRNAFNSAFGKIQSKYTAGVAWCCSHPVPIWCVLIVSIAALAWLMNTTKTGFVPDEDTGKLMISLHTRAGSSLSETSKAMDKLGEDVGKIEEIDNYATVAGYSFDGAGPSQGLIFITLKDWSRRQGKEHNNIAVIEKLDALKEKYPDISMFVAAPPMINGFGQTSGFELFVQNLADKPLAEHADAANRFAEALSHRPEISSAYSSFSADYPQYTLDVDAVKCQRAGFTPAEVLDALSGYLGGQYVSNFNRFSKVYRVMIQAEPDQRVTPESLNGMFVRNASGHMAPIGNFVELTKTFGPQSLNRMNLYGSITISGTAAEGYSTGEMLKAVAEVAAESLPDGFGYEFGGLSREESESSGNTMVVFGICFMLVLLILSALYESFFIPFAVIFAIPFGLMGSFIFTKIMGLENNIYMQTGLIMLIGLLAKTAILITEQAVKLRHSGLSLVESATIAAKVRLRPILMTALTMVFGILPMMVSSGVGANGNRTLGSCAVGGMLFGTVGLLFIVPVLFIFFENVQEKLFPTTLAYDTETENKHTEAEIKAPNIES